MSDIAVEPLLAQLHTNLVQVLTARGIENPALVGIHSGGAWIAQQLHARILTMNSHPIAKAIAASSTRSRWSAGGRMRGPG